MAIRESNRNCSMFSMVVFSLLLLAPALAVAQEPSPTLQALQSNVHQGEPVRLYGVDGSKIQGTIETISSSSLKLKVKGVSREFQESQIREIQVQYRDPIWNGVKWGVVIGGISGAVVGAIVSDAFCDGCGDSHASGALAFGLLGAGIGAGTGATSDYLRKGYTPVFKGQKVAEKGFNVSPIVSKSTKGVAVAFRF